MIRHPIFSLYALSLLGFASYAQFSGWRLFNDVDEFRGDPKQLRTVRDNPGAYRSIYSNYHRYSGGK